MALDKCIHKHHPTRDTPHSPQFARLAKTKAAQDHVAHLKAMKGTAQLPFREVVRLIRNTTMALTFWYQTNGAAAVNLFSCHRVSMSYFTHPNVDASAIKALGQPRQLTWIIGAPLDAHCLDSIGYKHCVWTLLNNVALIDRRHLLYGKLVDVYNRLVAPEGLCDFNALMIEIEASIPPQPTFPKLIETTLCKATLAVLFDPQVQY